MYLDSYDFPSLANQTVEVNISELVKLIQGYHDGQEAIRKVESLEFQLTRSREMIEHERKLAVAAENRSKDVIANIHRMMQNVQTKNLPPIYMEISALIASGQKIGAIKKHRDASHEAGKPAGLKESKEDIELLGFMLGIYNDIPAQTQFHWDGNPVVKETSVADDVLDEAQYFWANNLDVEDDSAL